jgi:hypothetical protein
VCLGNHLRFVLRALYCEIRRTQLYNRSLSPAFEIASRGYLRQRNVPPYNLGSVTRKSNQFAIHGRFAPGLDWLSKSSVITRAGNLFVRYSFSR